MIHLIAGLSEAISISIFSHYYIYGIVYFFLFLSFKDDKTHWIIKSILYNISFFFIGYPGLINTLIEYGYSQWLAIPCSLFINISIYLLFFLRSKNINWITSASIMALFHYFTIEYISSPIALGLAHKPNIINLSSFIGLIGYNFISYLILFGLVQKKYKKTSLFFLSVLLLSVSYSFIPKPKYETLETIVILSNKNPYKELHDNKILKKEFSLYKNNLVLYPENFIPHTKKELITKNKLVGVYHPKSSEVIFNNKSYFKQKHFIFGEYNPFNNEKSYKSIENFTIFNYNQYNFISLICFESSYAELLDKWNPLNYDFIVNNSSGYHVVDEDVKKGLDLHSIWRALENKRSFIKVNNGGTSLNINPDGIIKNKVKKEEIINRTSQSWLIDINKDISFYSKTTFWPYLIILIINIIFINIRNRKN